MDVMVMYSMFFVSRCLPGTRIKGGMARVGTRTGPLTPVHMRRDEASLPSRGGEQGRRDMEMRVGWWAAKVREMRWNGAGSRYSPCSDYMLHAMMAVASSSTAVESGVLELSQAYLP